MADRRRYNSSGQHSRNREQEFEVVLNKYCTISDIKRYKFSKDSQGNYVIIGSGAFGKVYEAIDVAARRRVAVKVMKKEHILASGLERRVLVEIRLHSKLMHPRIVEIYECFHDKTYVYIVLELCPGGDLEHYLRRGVLSEEMAASIFRQIVEGVLYLHRLKTDRDGTIIGNPILHRDLKPSNICFAKDNTVKIVDFNLAKEIVSDDQKNTTYCGTPGFMPPEVVLNLPYSFEVDAYGLGCILYSMLFGCPPGKRNDGGALNFDVHIPDGVISVEAENLLRNLLCKDQRQRMTVKSAAKDPFLMKYFQRKRLASIDSGFDTQHTGSSFPDSVRRHGSRERPIPRPAPCDANVVQCVVPFRRPQPLMPVHPPPDESTSVRLPPVFPSSSFRPPSLRRSPAPSRSSRQCVNNDQVNLPLPMPSSFDSAMPAMDDQASSRRPRSPIPTKKGHSSTTKVKYVSAMVQCVYMENGDMIARFADGKVGMKKGNSDEIVVARDKRKAVLTTLESLHFQKALSTARALERVCETECGVNATCDCFPVLVDKRKSSTQNS